jgi:hypothetical protein
MSPTGTPLPQEELPYIVELWSEDKSACAEKVLARAATAQLARAIFATASGEYPERRITLRLNDRTISDSSPPREAFGV